VTGPIRTQAQVGDGSADDQIHHHQRQHHPKQPRHFIHRSPPITYPIDEGVQPPSNLNQLSLEKQYIKVHPIPYNEQTPTVVGAV